MREHRGVIGGALLTATGGSWIAGPAVVASHQAHWSDKPVLGLIAAGGLCLILGIAVLAWPITRPAKAQSLSLAHEFAASFLKSEGMRPSRWQRLRHPRTPIGQLPVRVSSFLREKYRARQDALQEFIDELENNARDLGWQVNDVEIGHGPLFPGSAWERNRHLLNSDDLVWTREIVQDAYLRTHALNQKTRARFEAASAEDVNDADWKKLTDEELQERKDALEAVVAARSAVRQARDGQNPGGALVSRPQSSVMARVTEIKVEQIADDRKRRERCISLMERGSALKGEIAAASVSEMVQRITLDILEGDLRKRLDRWRIDSRGFITANTYGPLDRLVSEERERELLKEWTTVSVVEVIDSHLAMLEWVKDSIPATRLA